MAVYQPVTDLAPVLIVPLKKKTSQALVVAQPATESPVRQTRDIIQSQKEKEVMIEGRINFLNTKDGHILRSVEKARGFVNKRTVARKA